MTMVNWENDKSLDLDDFSHWLVDEKRGVSSEPP